jgi:hypothetical protein
MRIIITESKLKNLINNILGYDLSDRIKMITNWMELSYAGRAMFRDNRETFRFYLNHFGPFFEFSVGSNEHSDKYYVQYRGKVSGWMIFKEGDDRMLDEYDFLSLLGISSLGVKLNKIIDEFVIE